MSWEAIAAFITIGIGLIGIGVRNLILLTRQVTAMEVGLSEGAAVRHRALIEEVSRNRLEFAETVKAIKEHAELSHRRIDQVIIKVQEVELYIRDHYVEDETFRDALHRLEAQIKELSIKLDQAQERELARLRQTKGG